MLNELINLYPDIDVNKLKFYEEIVIKKIKNYLNIPSKNDNYIISNFPTAIKLAVGNEIENSNHKNIRSYKEGEQSITYENSNNTLSDEVKELLPFPKVRLL